MSPVPDLRAAVFLDRDGTIIQEKDYLADPEGVVLVSGAVEALERLRRAGLALVVVTNQSGIARGLYTLDQYRAVARRLDELLKAREVQPDATYFCPHHPDFTGPCSCRKPDTGMYREAARDLELDLARSFFVGDRIKDILPARELGGRGVLVRTGYGAREEVDLPRDMEAVDGLPEAASWILERVENRRRESP